MFHFDAFTRTAPHMSDRWATSDRGWLYDGDGEHDCLGFYLAYDAIPGYREAFVLACVYDRPRHPLTGNRTANTTNNRSRDWASVAEAQAWMLEQHTGQLTLV